MKGKSIGEPNIYLGVKIQSLTTSSGKKISTQGSSAYIQEAVKNVEEWLTECNMKLLSCLDTPMSTGYCLELDISLALDAKMVDWYQSAIGILWWAVEPGCINIMALPCEGHLVAVLCIFTYLRKHHKLQIAFNLTVPDIVHNLFPQQDWMYFHGNVKEPVPLNAPKPLGLPVTIHIFVDADHAGDAATRQSHMGYVMFLNNAVVNWYSKMQGSVEGATFGSEFMAMETTVEANQGFHYKL